MDGHRLTLEMTITMEDFLRLLPAALNQPFVRDGETFVIGDETRGIVLRVSGLPCRTVGVLKLERLRVDLEFRGLETREREAFLSRFRQQFHRGGG